MGKSGDKKSTKGGLSDLFCFDVLESEMLSLGDLPRPIETPANSTFFTPLDSHSPAEELPNTLFDNQLFGQSRAPTREIDHLGKRNFELFTKCIEALKVEFLQRRSELLKINNARRIQIESFLKEQVNVNVKVDEAVGARPNTSSALALEKLAACTAVFHFLQFLLFKRWQDLGILTSATEKSHTVQWKITNFLRDQRPKKILSKNEWHFLKQNIFSWFQPSQSALEMLSQLLLEVKFADKNQEFPKELLHAMKEQCLKDSGKQKSQESPMVFSLAKTITSSSVESNVLDDFSHDTRSLQVFISGLAQGNTYFNLRTFFPELALSKVWCFSDNEWERYLSEILVLWWIDLIPSSLNIHERSALAQSSHANRSSQLFLDTPTIPYQTDLAICISNEKNEELKDASEFIKYLKDSGLLIFNSGNYWPTENSDDAQAFRESALKSCVVKLMIDCRNIMGSSELNLPKAFFVLEKCENKERRDTNRPVIIRMRGTLRNDQMDQIWPYIQQAIQSPPPPGEQMLVTPIGLQDSLKMEIMSAATSQDQLKSSPWLTITDPRFFDLSTKLRSNPQKAFLAGTLLKIKGDGILPSPRGIHLLEDRSTGFLNASLTMQKSNLTAGQNSFYFLPESSCREEPLFFVSQMMSSPIQFWNRLETELLANNEGRYREKKTELKLKLMPLVRIFESGTLLPMQKKSTEPFFLERCQKQLEQAISGFENDIGKRVLLHNTIVEIEQSIGSQMKSCADMISHLHPDFSLLRCRIPSELPAPEPQMVFAIFQHLDQSPLALHPSVHLTKLRPTNDFRVTNIVYHETHSSMMGEIQLSQGLNPVLKLNGPSLLLKAAADEINRRIGRPWTEISTHLRYPTDLTLVQNQLKEINSCIKTQLKETKNAIQLVDKVFAVLHGISRDLHDEDAIQHIAQHLAPGLPTSIKKQSNTFFETIRPQSIESESPKGLLQ